MHFYLLVFSFRHHNVSPQGFIYTYIFLYANLFGKRFVNSSNLARSVEKYEREALFTGCRVFAFPHRTKRKRATMSFCMKKAVLLIG